MKKGIAGFITAIVVFGISSITSFAATGTVTASTANIREQPNAESTVVASTAKGSKVDIVGAQKDSSGTVWYKVPIAGGSYGYVRNDLIETSDKIEVSSTQSTQQTQETTKEKPAPTVPTSIGEQAATVKCDTNVKIRSGASTSHDVITSLPNGTSITLIGEANDAAGNKWYQLRCNYNNKEIEGYIRSDLIAIGTASEENTESDNGEETQDEDLLAAEGEGDFDVSGESQETEPEEPVEENNDYEIVYMEDTNNPGQFHYYLYDNRNGTRQDVEVLLQAVSISNENVNVLQEEISHGKIIIIVLAVVVVLLFAALTFLFIKLRSAGEYEDYEDDEEEEYEEPKRRETVKREPIRREPTRREPVQREPVRERRMQPERPVKKEPSAQPEEKMEKAVRQPRKAQNFLTDDDEFEFEFLNMDDKDL